LQIEPHVVDVAARIILDFVEHRTFTYNKIDASACLDDAPRRWRLIEHKVAVEGIVGKPQGNTWIELSLLHFYQGVREVHAAHIGNHGALFSPQRKEKTATATSTITKT